MIPRLVLEADKQRMTDRAMLAETKLEAIRRISEALDTLAVREGLQVGDLSAGFQAVDRVVEAVEESEAMAIADVFERMELHEAREADVVRVHAARAKVDRLIDDLIDAVREEERS